MIFALQDIDIINRNDNIWETTAMSFCSLSVCMYIDVVSVTLRGLLYDRRCLDPFQ